TPRPVHFPRYAEKPRGPIGLTVIAQELVSQRGERGDGVLRPKPVFFRVEFEQHDAGLYLAQPVSHGVENHALMTLHIDLDERNGRALQSPNIFARWLDADADLLAGKFPARGGKTCHPQ